MFWGVFRYGFFFYSRRWVEGIAFRILSLGLGFRDRGFIGGVVEGLVLGVYVVIWICD